MNTFLRTIFVAVIATPACFAQSQAGDVDFNRDIRPILAANCFACHGPDEHARESNLRLDTSTGATADLGHGRAIVPGNLGDSLLIERITSDDRDVLMPPPDSGRELTDAQKRQLRDWIADGAKYEVHWSFVPPVRTSPPAVRREEWPQNAIDHFVLARLEAANLGPAAPADRYRLLRRVSLDLTGLPPTPEQADAFAADNSSDAFHKVVDRLLADESFGEHWARMWLDLARYADTKGYEKDRPRQIWRYRDWVIAALNEDMPFDQFTREQLAGDLLTDPTTDQLIATAFHRNTMTNEEGGTDDEEFRIAAVKDRVDTTVQVWMGLTMGCAKCHSHKFDPLSQRDYYQFYAFFNQTQDADREAPTVKTPTAEQRQQEHALTTRLEQLRKPASGSVADEIRKTTEELKKLRATFPTTPVLRELPPGKQRTTQIHQRGNFLSPGETVTAQVPPIFGTWPENAPRNRLGVAQWILQPQNPLTTRVMVNRVWSRLFGRGIVRTEEDFGAQGTPPTHPELLDWLAVEFRENGWSLKKLMRTIVLSATYQQAQTLTPRKIEIDPENTLFSRGARFRLPAESIRDQALAVSGLLTHKAGGPSVMPPQPPRIWKSTYSALKWKDATGPDRYRRALYTYWKRTSPYPALTTFDAGSGEVCQIRRVRTNTPLQALITLNDPAYLEAAGGLAGIMQQAGASRTEQIVAGFRRTLTRPPTDDELRRLLELAGDLRKQYAQPQSADELRASAAAPDGDPVLIVIASVLLNLDETLMKP